MIKECVVPCERCGNENTHPVKDQPKRDMCDWLCDNCGYVFEEKIWEDNEEGGADASTQNR